MTLMLLKLRSDQTFKLEDTGDEKKEPDIDKQVDCPRSSRAFRGFAV